MMKTIIINETNFDKARRQIIELNRSKSEEKPKIVFQSGDDELNRKIIEKSQIDILLLNLSRKKDRIKQRESGFNQVLAKIAQKNKISIGINVDEIFLAENLGAKSKSEVISRIQQNIKICNKNKLKMFFISPSKKNINKKDFQSLGLILGMPTWMMKDCFLD